MKRQRRQFTPEFKAKVVLEILAGTQSPAEVCCRHALGLGLLGLWKSSFLERAHTLFQPDDERDEDQARIADLEQLLGRATRQIEILKRGRVLGALNVVKGFNQPPHDEPELLTAAQRG